MMSKRLTEEEKEFIDYWENEGDREKKWTYMLRKNLPKGLIFSLPIALFFFAMGYKRRALVSHGDLVTIMIALVIIAIFYAIFKGHVHVDRYESHYQVLKKKESGEKGPGAISSFIDLKDPS